MIGGFRIAPLAVLLLAVTACEDAGIVSPPAEGAPTTGASQFSEQLSLADLQQSASSAAVRVEVKLQSDTAPLVAREVERAGEDAVREQEKIEGRITAADEQGVTLALGGIQVGFDAATRFRAEGGDTLTRAEFLTRLQTALTDGRQPSIEAERAAPAEPQAPDVATFVASEVEIDDEAAEPKLELNIDADNLQLGATPSAGAVLRVLGLTIEIRGSETEVESRRRESRGRVKFEGLVASADETGGSVTLRDGRVIRLVQGTEVESKKGKLRSVAEVAAALTAGQLVEAEGKGILENATTLLAVEVEFEVEEEADDVPHASRLKDLVTAVDVQGGTFTLAGGQVVRVVEGTRIKGKGLSSLQQVADSVAAQRPVRAEGKLLLESAGTPPTYIALEIHFKFADRDGREEAPGVGKIAGRISSVDLQGGSFTLASGAQIKVTTTTAIDTTGDLRTLQAVADALAAGAKVKVEGRGTLESDGPPRVMAATSLRFESVGGDAEGEERPDEVEFEAAVDSVDVAGGTFVLSDERVVRLTEDAEVEGDLRTLQQIADALLGGKVVEVEGKATIESQGPPVILLAHKAKFEVKDD